MSDRAAEATSELEMVAFMAFSLLEPVGLGSNHDRRRCADVARRNFAAHDVRRMRRVEPIHGKLSPGELHPRWPFDAL